jgi:ribosomal protein S10
MSGRKVLGLVVYGPDKTVPYIAKRIKIAARLLNIRVTGPVPLPMTIKKFTLQKSPFSDKKARSQYEFRTKRRLLKIDAPSMVANKFMQYVKTYLPPIAGMTGFKGTEQNFLPLKQFYTGKRVA